MNVAGVALATILSQGYSAVALMVVLSKRADACRLCIREMRPYKAQLLKMLRIGIPAGIQASIYSVANVLLQSSYNSFGDIAMRGISAARNIEGFIYAAINSFNQATINFVGQNVGAKKPHRVKQGLLSAIGISAVFSAVYLLVAIFLAYRGRSLLTVSLSASAAVMLTEWILKIVK
jgi:Na+-driven multidrug efflux pump